MQTSVWPWLVMLLTMVGQPAQGHVALTFPVARQYDLDFLDSSRTKAPCGMPKGEIRTAVKAGTKLNITWHLGYPHQGGFRLELLDPSEKHLRDLTPTSEADKRFLGDDATAQSFEWMVPSDLTCEDCTIRLVRQATEWGKKYLFWSCADVNILPAGRYREDCSGHGRAIAGRCRCDRLYYGDRCQFQDECVEDEDCGRHGRCVNIEATSAPKKQCFCELGYFGSGCSQESPIKSKEIQEGLYTKREVSDKFTLFWRVLKDVDEIEVAIRAKGTGYVGIGWRPLSASKQCQKLPNIPDSEDDNIPQSTPVEEPESEPESEPDAEQEEDTVASESRHLDEEAESESQQGSKRVEKSIDVSIGFVTSSVSSAEKRKREAEENGAQEEPPSTDKTVTEPESEPEGDNQEEEEEEENTETSSLISVSIGGTEAEPEVESEATAEAEATPEPRVEGATSYTPRGEFHAMDCVDMVIGMARGDASRIWDYYTRDRSTPRRDTYWGGTNDLTGAIGFEKDGETVIIFRKKIKANGFTDHEITNEEMHVIWALGQEPGQYSHVPHSGLEAGTPSLPNFYRPDELKYHGRQNRGVFQLNFFNEVRQSIGANAGVTLDFCGGEWRYPRDCQSANKTCEYFVRWKYDETIDKIDFTVQSIYSDRWTGIGFSDTPAMSQTDAIIGFVESNGHFFIMDMWTTSYLQPALESSQDLTNMEGIIEDGLTTLKFTRKRNTGDKQDVAFTDDKAMYMIFPVKGGRFNAVNKKLRKHEATPIASSERIFIRPCRTEDGKATFTTTPRPAQLVYRVSLQFVELGELYVLPSRGTKEYKELQERIAKSVKGLKTLLEVPGFQDVTVNKFTSQAHGQFMADLSVSVNKDEYESGSPSGQTVEKALEEAVKTGRVGALKVNPESLITRSPISVEAPSNINDTLDLEDQGFLSKPKLYFIIACVVALLVIALLQATCTIYRMFLSPAKAKAQAAKPDKLPPSAWKDYSANGSQHTNYAYEPFDHPANAMPSEDIKRQHLLLRSQPIEDPYAKPQQSGNSISRLRAATAAPPPPPGYNRSSATNGTNGYGSYDRRSTYRAGGPALPGHHPSGAGDYAPDHYFMPSQRKYGGDTLKLYVDYNK